MQSNIGGGLSNLRRDDIWPAMHGRGGQLAGGTEDWLTPGDKQPFWPTTP